MCELWRQGCREQESGGGVLAVALVLDGARYVVAVDGCMSVHAMSGESEGS